MTNNTEESNRRRLEIDMEFHKTIENIQRRNNVVIGISMLIMVISVTLSVVYNIYFE